MNFLGWSYFAVCLSSWHCNLRLLPNLEGFCCSSNILSALLSFSVFLGGFFGTPMYKCWISCYCPIAPWGSLHFLFSFSFCFLSLIQIGWTVSQSSVQKFLSNVICTLIKVPWDFYYFFVFVMSIISLSFLEPLFLCWVFLFFHLTQENVQLNVKAVLWGLLENRGQIIPPSYFTWWWLISFFSSWLWYYWLLVCWVVLYWILDFLICYVRRLWGLFQSFLLVGSHTVQLARGYWPTLVWCCQWQLNFPSLRSSWLIWCCCHSHWPCWNGLQSRRHVSCPDCLATLGGRGGERCPHQCPLAAPCPSAGEEMWAWEDTEAAWITLSVKVRSLLPALLTCQVFLGGPWDCWVLRTNKLPRQGYLLYWVPFLFPQPCWYLWAGRRAWAEDAACSSWVSDCCR